MPPGSSRPPPSPETFFTPGCPCCAEELGLNGVPPAPASRHRHPASGLNDFMRKELTQCQQCWKSKGSGITLFRCSGCKIDLYCSKECQKNAWPLHKTKCRLNQRVHNMPQSSVETSRLLRAFTSKHRPSIADAGVRALNLRADPKRAKDFALVIFLRSREGSRRTETAFYATGADVVSFDYFPTKDEMREQLQYAHDQNVRAGADLIGALFVVLVDVDTMISNIAPVGFSREVCEPPGNWKEDLFRRLNDGAVV